MNANNTKNKNLCKRRTLSTEAYIIKQDFSQNSVSSAELNELKMYIWHNTCFVIGTTMLGGNYNPWLNSFISGESIVICIRAVE